MTNINAIGAIGCIHENELIIKTLDRECHIWKIPDVSEGVDGLYLRHTDPYKDYVLFVDFDPCYAWDVNNESIVTKAKIHSFIYIDWEAEGKNFTVPLNQRITDNMQFVVEKLNETLERQ